MTKETQKQLSMEVARMTIQLSIVQIKNLEQVQSTRNWIDLFELRFGASEVAGNLRDELNLFKL